MPEQFRINGAIVCSGGVDESCITIQVFRRDLPSLERRTGSIPQLLGVATTDGNGQFSITFSLRTTELVDGDNLSAYGLRKQNATLSLSALDHIGRSLRILRIDALGRSFGPDEIIFNAPVDLNLTVFVGSEHARGESEYERLIARFMPIVQDVSLADLTDDDCAFVVHELGLKQEEEHQFECLRRSAKLARQTELPVEAIYGWGVLGVSSGVGKLGEAHPTDMRSWLLRLLDETNERLRTAIRNAIGAGVIPDLGTDRITEIMAQVERQKVINGALIVRRFIGRLRCDTSGDPLAGLRVRCWAQSAGLILEGAGEITSDSTGLFVVTYLMPPDLLHEEVDHCPTLRLEVLLDASSGATFELESAAQDDQNIVDILIPVDTLDETPLSRLVGCAAIKDSDVVSFLSEKGIHTLQDLQHMQRSGQLEEVLCTIDVAVGEQLLTHLNLFLVSSDIGDHIVLIESGHSSIDAIAGADRADFVAQVGDHIGVFKAAQLHEAARAQTMLLTNVKYDLAAGHHNLPGGHLRDSEQANCHCQDCESAVSPLAYLADLFKFATETIKNAGEPVTGDELSALFYQRFNLPVECALVDKQVKQVRLCVEVLRRFARLDAKAESDYLLSIYTAVLTNIGTSFTEIRLACNGDSLSRQAVADRLGIASDHVSDLFLDPKANPAVLTEARLEQLFGVVSTTRDPFLPAGQPQLPQWKSECLRSRWFTEDFPDDLYLRKTYPTSAVPLKQLPNGVALPSYIAKYDKDRQQLVCTDELSYPHLLLLLGLSADGAYQQAVKELFYASQRLPVIDPDVVGPDDFRFLSIPDSGSPRQPFNLWKLRREWVDARLGVVAALTKTIQVDGRTEQVPDLAAMFSKMYQPVAYPAGTVVAWASTTPTTEFESLWIQLKQGVNNEANKFRLKYELNLTVDAFTRLMAINNKAKEWESDTRLDRVSSEEWREVYSILVQAQKLKLYPIWREEENDEDNEFGNYWVPLCFELFWPSLREPQEGEWPPLLQSGIPLIDPDLLKRADLADPAAGAKAIAFWHERQARLEAISKDVAAQRQTSGFDAALRFALGHPSPGNPLQYEFAALKTELESPVPATVVAATKKITDDLHLTVDNFKRVIGIKAKNDQLDPQRKPTPADWAELYAILTTARKIKHEYPVWVAQEQQAQTGVAYWNALKAKLPRWRASSEARQAWRRVLLDSVRPPIVDPDLIGPRDFKTPPSDEPFSVSELWNYRKDQIGRVEQQLRSRPATAAGLDDSIQKTIGVTLARLLAIAVEHEKGNAIGERLAQLTLEVAEFNYLVRVCKLATASQPILDVEWENVYSILIQIWKRRISYWWRNEEREERCFHSPDLFESAPPTPVLLSSREPSVVEIWRAPRSAYEEWRSRLQSRVEQQESVIQGLQESISAAEETELPKLRDALLKATDIPGDLDAKANAVTERLYIDAKMSGAAMTTRVSQTIETLQGLLFALRSRPLSRVNNLLDVFALGNRSSETPKLYHKASDGKQWFPPAETWESFGDSLSCKAVSQEMGRIHVFGSGPGVRTLHKEWDGRSWQPGGTDWELIEGKIASDVIVSGPDRVDLFCVHDYKLWHKAGDGRSWLPSGATWEDLGQSCYTPHNLLSWGANRIDIFGIGWGSNAPVLHKAWDGTRWLPSNTEWEKLGGNGRFNTSQRTRLRTISWGPNRIDIFGVATDGKLLHRAWDGTRWSPDWESLGGNFVTSPSVVSWGPNRLDIFGVGPNFEVLHKARDGAQWLPSATDWEDLGGRVDNMPWLESEGQPWLVSWGPNRLDIFAIASRETFHKAWDGVRWWPSRTGWQTLGVGGSDLRVVSWGPNRLDLFATSAGSTAPGGAIVHKAWDGREWVPAGTGWKSLGRPPLGEFATFIRQPEIVSRPPQVLPAGLNLSLKISTDEFDAKWTWIGSYATWRAATLVLLYPENILLPSLRKWQTPAFESLVSSLRLTSKLTPAAAKQAASDYAQYLRDVCSLRVEASCTSYTGFDEDSRPIFYMFARGGSSGTVYWSASDAQDSSGYGQTFWAPVAGVSGTPLKDWKDVTEVIGATPYQVGPGRHYIYLFARKRESGRYVSVCGRFDIEKQVWLEEVLKLSTLAGEPDSPDALLQRQSGTEPPLVAFSPLLSVRQLNTAGDQWAITKSGLFFNGLGGAASKVEALLEAASGGFYLIVSGGNDTTCFLFLPVETAGRPAITLVPPPPADPRFRPVALLNFTNRKYRGSGTISGSNDIYIFFHMPDTYIVDQYRIKDSGSSVLSLTHTPIYLGPDTAIPRVAPTSGAPATNRVVIQKGATSFTSPLPSEWGRGTSVAPEVTNLTEITLHPTGQDSQHRKATIKADYLKNISNQLIVNPKSNLTYIEEAYYCVPIQIALSLQKSGEYQAALDWFRLVYDYTLEGSLRKIYHGLVVEETQTAPDMNSPTWMFDPLNPHLIAATRQNSYTRFTLLAIIQCLLDYADSEFTRDTTESNGRARQLYLKALQLFDSKEIRTTETQCNRILRELDDVIVPDAAWRESIQSLKEELKSISDLQTMRSAVSDIRQILLTSDPFEARIDRARAILNRRRKDAPPVTVLAAVIKNAARVNADLLRRGNPTLTTALTRLGACVKEEFRLSVAHATGFSDAELSQPEFKLAWLQCGESATDKSPEMRLALRQSLGLKTQSRDAFLPGIFSDLCVPPNPRLRALRMRGEMNLAKLRSCRNIAGLRRQVEPYSAPTDSTSGLPTTGTGGQLVLPGVIGVLPTVYRYPVLVERAKQLVQLAGQIEASMLSALVQRDAEAYTLLRARQDLSLAQAGVQLQSLRVTEADNGAKLAGMQKSRAEKQAVRLQSWIEGGLIEYEKTMITAYHDAATAERSAADISRDIQIKQSAISSAQLAAMIAATPYGGLTGLATGGANFTIDAIMFSNLSEATKKALDAAESAQTASVKASFERRKQEWELQQLMAQEDIAIGAQEVLLAEDHLKVVKQEQVIGELQASSAKDTIEFLTSKFTNVDLFDWMSGILEGVYRFFLEQAAAMARLAENQLAFERQEAPPAYIQADYWSNPSDGAATARADSKLPDRKGLTGSARLLQDIYQLDQYAFDTNKRKLSISKTISLARLVPFEFQRFRDTGVMAFMTPMEMFDRGFPGHYLRLIKRVRISIIALVPPMEGVHATLSTTGPSRVVIGGDVFQTIPIHRPPELIVLSAPSTSSGVLELESPSDMLLPFEGSGVEMNWEFSMPKAANLIDYQCIADVLITLEYTALNSFDYRPQVIQTLNPNLSAERPFSFRNQFADQWYDLHNPDQTKAPMVVRFETSREDFPLNLEHLKIQQVLLYFVRNDDKSFEVPLIHLRYTAQGDAAAVGGSAVSIDGIISTRRGNAGSWIPLIGRSPVGEWELALPNTEELRARFANEEIEDILLVIAYSGRTSNWPT